MAMMHDDTNFIRPYYLNGVPEDENYIVPPKDGDNFFGDSNAFLFPYNRKTSKIGGK